MTLDALIQSYQVGALAPELILSLFALAVLLAGAFFPDSAQKRLMPLLALLGVGVSGAATAALWNKNLVFGAADTAIYGADNFALFFKWIFLLTLAIAILMSGRFLDPRSGDSHVVTGEFYGLMMLSTVGMMFVAGARDLLVIFLGIETLSIALYVLAGFARRRLISNEAALKYLLLGAFASGFLLYGIALTFYATGSTHLANIATAVSNASTPVREGVSPIVLFVGIALMLVGLAFKAALVPFHQWTPDVYQGAPTPVTAFMAAGAKAAAFAALLRILPGTFGVLTERWLPLLLVIAALTMTVGNISAIAQKSVKRMLAYSSVAHAGYLLIGVIAAALAVKNSQTDAAHTAIGSTIYYLLAYSIMNLGAFALMSHLEQARSPHVAPIDIAPPAPVAAREIEAQVMGERAEENRMQSQAVDAGAALPATVDTLVDDDTIADEAKNENADDAPANASPVDSNAIEAPAVPAQTIVPVATKVVSAPRASSVSTQDDGLSTREADMVRAKLERERALSAEDAEDGDTTMEQLRGLAWRDPFAAAMMSLFLLSLAGIPPLVGFFGKLFLFRDALGQGLLGLVLVGVINSVISVAYYLRPLLAMYGRDGEAELDESGLMVNAAGAGALARPAKLSLSLTLAIVSCAMAVVAMSALQIVVLPYIEDAARTFLIGK